jgi:hypothetical protein
MHKFKFQPMSLIFTFALMGPVAASIDSEPLCLVDTDTNTATITVTVDSSSTLSSSAVIQLDGVSIAGAHTLSNNNRSISAVYGQTCDNQVVEQITVVDGSTTHQ